MNFYHNIFAKSSQLKRSLLVMAILSWIQSSMTHITFTIVIVIEEHLVSQPVGISWYLFIEILKNGNQGELYLKELWGLFAFVSVDGVLDMAIETDWEYKSDLKSLL